MGGEHRSLSIPTLQEVSIPTLLEIFLSRKSCCIKWKLWIVTVFWENTALRQDSLRMFRCSDEYLTWSPSSHLLQFHTDGSHAACLFLLASYWKRHLVPEFSLLSSVKVKQYCNSVAISRWKEVCRVWRFVSEILYYYISIINIISNITLFIIIIIVAIVAI